ncbi:hypothetical protein CROQUDRAFT_50669 [Cronartium quercuum f. sp. fusiforme G11]|uniref:Uncharacterized protein n=1 Tax=Cronartium quercuum f. sp. fusiforme G11 TaxID=708437 RepID=A0A9P6NAR4_9BASI|nr:hypothetical protein CROQUDRAFT_50669 [Cronartium quercuum f. sp. fusiforme G11]
MQEKRYEPLSVQNLNMIQEGKLGEHGEVTFRVYELQSQTGLTRRQANLTIDLTPADYTSLQCYPGAFERPLKADCDKVWVAQLYNSTGSLTAFPGTMVYVNAGTCAVVFQNPQKISPTLQFNWAKLGKVGQTIANECFPPKNNSIGGVGIFAHYLEYRLDDVLISVQKHVEGS